MSPKYPRILPDLGYAQVSITILEQGVPVGIMGRDEPDGEYESGWTFLAGTETAEEVDDEDTYVRTSLNTIAFMDPDIVPFVTGPPGTLVVRKVPGAPLRVVEGPKQAPEVVFDLPVGPGRVQLGPNWAAVSPDDLLRRVDHGSLVLWRDGLSIWIAVGTAEEPWEVAQEVERVRQRRSPDATAESLTTSGGVTKLVYWLTREGQLSLHGVAWAGAECLRAAITIDSDRDQVDAFAFWDSVVPGR